MPTDRITQYIEENQEQLLADIARLIAVPSFTPQGAARALETILSMASAMGFDTKNENGLIGWAQLGEVHTGTAYLAMISHVDTVPPGDGWNTDPFTLCEKDGWLIGRGVTDDKTGALLSLYALKFLRENRIPLNYPIRALFGTNEETSMEDVEFYLAHHPAPAFCFTPDADFPVGHGEKGRYSAQIVSFPTPDEEILSIEGGFAVNAVPATASAAVRFSGRSWQETPGVTAILRDGKAEIHAVGRSAHASMPEGSVNAIGLLVDALLQNNVGNPAETAYLHILQQLHASTDGSAIGIAATNAHFSPLTIIGGTIKKENGRIYQTLDSRFPPGTTGDTLTAALKKRTGDAAELSDISVTVPFFIEETHPAIQTCLQAFRCVTGQTAAQPFTMGGGTYARHFPCAISFGPQPADLVRPDSLGGEHASNEAFPLKAIRTALKIYITALCGLEQVAF